MLVGLKNSPNVSTRLNIETVKTLDMLIVCHDFRHQLPLSTWLQLWTFTFLLTIRRTPPRQIFLHQTVQLMQHNSQQVPPNHGTPIKAIRLMMSSLTSKKATKAEHSTRVMMSSLRFKTDTKRALGKAIRLMMSSLKWKTKIEPEKTNILHHWCAVWGYKWPRSPWKQTSITNHSDPAARSLAGYSTFNSPLSFRWLQAGGWSGETNQRKVSKFFPHKKEYMQLVLHAQYLGNYKFVFHSIVKSRCLHKPIYRSLRKALLAFRDHMIFYHIDELVFHIYHVLRINLVGLKCRKVLLKRSRNLTSS